MSGQVVSRRDGRTAVSARRLEILEAATEVFAERGIVAATVRDIGERVGILSGSLYHHFSSKEEMITEILVPVLRGQIDAFDAISSETDDAREVVQRVIRAAVHQTAVNPHTARILRNDSHHIRENPGLADVMREQAAIVVRWVSAVQDGITSGRFRPEINPHIATMSIADVVLGAYRFMKPIGRHSPEYVTVQLTATILDGLNAAPRP